MEYDKETRDMIEHILSGMPEHWKDCVLHILGKGDWAATKDVGFKVGYLCGVADTVTEFPPVLGE